MDQPFDCTCGELVRCHPFQMRRYLPPRSQSCLRRIEGATALSKEELFGRGIINPWISDAIRERDFAKLQSHDGAN
jgi:hypothetical protein